MKKMNRHFRIAAAALLAASALALSACASAAPAQSVMTVSENEVPLAQTPAPASSAASSAKSGLFSNFTTSDLDGKKVTSADVFKGYDLVLINVWATYCGPCKEELPELAQLSRDYADKKVRVVGIVADSVASDGSLFKEQVETAKSLLASTGADYLQLAPSGLYSQLQDVYAVPTSYLVDGNGAVIGDAIVGGHSASEWKKVIDSALGTKT